MPQLLSEINSQKFKFWSFISMVLLVFVHGYNLDIRFLQPWTIPGEPMTVTAFTEYLFANGLFRFRIPMLFIISGFLFAMHDQTPHSQRIKKRARTLLLPYLLWSGAGFLLVLLMEMTVLGRDLIATTRMLQLDEHRIFLRDYAWYEVLGRWIFAPLPYQLWFLRSLFVYNLAYPAIRWCVAHPVAQKILFGVAGLMWLSSISLFFVEGEGLLFFSLGVWIQKNGFNIDRAKPALHPALWGSVFVLSAVIKTAAAFYGQDVLGEAISPALLILHKLTVVSGLIAVWYSSTGLVQWFMSKRWFVWLSAFSFIIYAVHAPLVVFAIEGVFRYVNHLPYYRILTFIILPSILILGSVLFGTMLRKFSPKAYSVLTGGRGLQ
jgi:fucose 4-O-acetylase-like acetyltransferase